MYERMYERMYVCMYVCMNVCNARPSKSKHFGEL